MYSCMPGELPTIKFIPERPNPNFESIEAIPEALFQVDGFGEREAWNAKQVLLIRAYMGDDVHATVSEDKTTYMIWDELHKTSLSVAEWTKRLQANLKKLDRYR